MGWAVTEWPVSTWTSSCCSPRQGDLVSLHINTVMSTVAGADPLLCNLLIGVIIRLCDVLVGVILGLCDLLVGVIVGLCDLFMGCSG